MRHIKRFSWVLPIFVIVLVWSVLRTTKTGDSKVAVSGGDSNEIVVTISPGDRSMLDEGDALRKAFELREAIEVYQNVLVSEGIDPEIKAEAHYNIGLCYTWTGEFDRAEKVFQDILQTYHDNGMAKAYAEYCLAWLEVQNGEYDAATARLQRILDEKTCNDMELYSRTRFQIGRIYKVYLMYNDRANAEFHKVLVNYPDSKAAMHPFLNLLRAEN